MTRNSYQLKSSNAKKRILIVSPKVLEEKQTKNNEDLFEKESLCSLAVDGITGGKIVVQKQINERKMMHLNQVDV